VPRPTSRILVAEPDRLQLQLIDMLLAAGEHELTLVATGREALEHLKAHTPDLCVLALDLPDVAGDVICGKLRRVTRLARTPVILIAPQSGSFGLSDKARALARRAGADLVLPRPLGDKNLRERVQFLLDARDATPTREGLTTQVIEEALEHLDPEAPVPDGADPSPAVASADPPGDGLGGGAGGARPGGDPAAAADPPPRTAPAPSTSGRPGSTPHPPRRGAAGGGTPENYTALRQELESLRIENAQLRRKLHEKTDALERGVNPKLEKRIRELERRNQALLDAIEEMKNGRDDGRGGLFGRRK
jgi:CheY-like chemotaxis protein